VRMCPVLNADSSARNPRSEIVISTVTFLRSRHAILPSMHPREQSMTYLRFGLALVFVACVNVRVISADDNTIPGRFTFKFGGDPIWISAAEAITPSGALRPEVHRPEHMKRLMTRWQEQEAFRKSVDTQQVKELCDITFAERFTEGPDEGSITSLAVLDEIAATRSVINGTVSASAVGIHDGAPYTILQIDADSMEAFPKRVYLMYSRGRLQFDGMAFCNNSPAYSELPRIGDPIMFIASYPLDSTGTLFFTSWIVYERETAVVSSQGLQLEPDARPKSVRAFADRLRSVQQRQNQ
jgi:hypothetical protein